MAKTDDPTFDALVDLRKTVLDLQDQLTKEQEANKAFRSAVNAFLAERWSDHINDWCSVVDWHKRKLRKEQEAREIEQNIIQLESKGFVVQRSPVTRSAVESVTAEESEAILNRIRSMRDRRMERLEHAVNSDQLDPGSM